MGHIIESAFWIVVMPYLRREPSCEDIHKLHVRPGDEFRRPEGVLKIEPRCVFFWVESLAPAELLIILLESAVGDPIPHEGGVVDREQEWVEEVQELGDCHPRIHRRIPSSRLQTTQAGQAVPYVLMTLPVRQVEERQRRAGAGLAFARQHFIDFGGAPTLVCPFRSEYLPPRLKAVIDVGEGVNPFCRWSIRCKGNLRAGVEVEFMADAPSGWNGAGVSVKSIRCH